MLSLAETVSANLKPALDVLIGAADEVHDTLSSLQSAIEATHNGYEEFTAGLVTAIEDIQWSFKKKQQ